MENKWQAENVPRKSQRRNTDLAGETGPRKELGLARKKATVKWAKIRIKDLFSKWGSRKLTQAATEREEK